jgi:hypothetical protein
VCSGHALSECYDPEIVFVVVSEANVKVNVVVVLGTLSANVLVSRNSICCCCCFGHALSECHGVQK